MQTAIESPLPQLRPETRPEIRHEMRDDDPRAAAAARAQEILAHLGTLDDGIDEYRIDPSIVPPGWSYEWKMRSVLGAENPSYQVALARTGWQPVPRSRHPEMMPQDWPGDTIERKGQVLMERPQVITDMQRQTDKSRARDQVRVKEQQLSNAPQGQMPRSGDAEGDARTRPNIKRAYEPMPIPADK